MATYSEIFDVRYGSAELRKQVVVAIAIAAQQILAEDPNTENHGARAAWAKRALSDTQPEAERFMWGILANPTVQANKGVVSDSDIQFVTNSLIGGYL